LTKIELSKNRDVVHPSLKPFTMPIDTTMFNQVNLLVVKDDEYVLSAVINGKTWHKKKLKNAKIVNDVTVEIDSKYVRKTDVLTAHEISTDICGDGPFLDNLWLVDGTGSYTKNIKTAKQEFKRNRDFLQQMNTTSRMGISYFSDRDGDFNRNMDIVFKDALPLIDIFSITDAFVDAAFDAIGAMYEGGDAFEGNNLKK